MSIKDYHSHLLESKKIKLITEDDEKAEENENYSQLLIEAIAAINKMLAVLAPSDPDVVSEYADRKRELGDNVDDTPASHAELWSGLSGIARDLQNSIVNSEQWKVKDIKSAEYLEELAELEKEYDDGTISKKDYSKELSELIKKYTSKEAQNIFFERTKTAFQYYQEAVRAFGQGGLTLLKSAGKNASWLNQATDVAKSTLAKSS